MQSHQPKLKQLPHQIFRFSFQVIALIALILQSVSVTAPAQAAGCSSPADCVSKMTLDEKIGQMTQVSKNALTTPSDITTYFIGSLLSGGGEGPNGTGGTSSQWADMYDNYQTFAVQTRLGIPLIYGVDAVHGNNNISGAVIFPHNIGMGATRDAALVQQEEAVVRDEVLGTGIDWVFAPCVCAPQDDRWGRTYEGFGEDTALIQTMTAAAVQGFQGSGLGTTTVMATAKHYVGDGGTTYGTGSSGYLIDQGNTQIDEATLRAVHLPPYQTAVANNVGSVMVSFSSWNGTKMHANQYLITTVLKGELGFKGIVVSDWGGINAISTDYPTAVRTAINAGIDMVMVPTDYKTFISTLRNEVNAGRVPVSRIDDAVTRILTQKFALGLFTKFKTDRTYTAQVGSAAHRAVARQAVRESQVLLKNDGVLPLSRTGTYKIVVGGSHVDDLGYQMGGWSITWQGGSGTTTTGGTTFWQALQATKPAGVTLQNVGTNTASSYTGDIGIAVVGETPYAEGKGDSSTLALSSADATQVSDICSRTTKCVVILISGRPVLINTQLSRANAFVAAWLPGTEGAGMTDVLFGDFNFTGKLPVTWPNALSQEPINNGDGKTGLFPFGFGLSYGTVITPTPTRTPTVTNTPPGPTSTPTPTRTATWTITPTSMVCNPPTPELLRVSPVTSPTSATTQVITVTLNHSTSVTVTDEAGSVTSTTPVGNVFSVTINLVSNSTNHVQVLGKVTYTQGCPPYSLLTTLDINGNPLNIVQGTVITPTPTRTPTITNTPVGPTATLTRTATRTNTPVGPSATPTPTTTTGGTCSPVTATITAPFTQDGAGTFCWQIATIPSYTNNWNLVSLTINGVNYTGQYVAAANLPAKINGFYYISYTSTVAWGHFEAK